MECLVGLLGRPLWCTIGPAPSSTLPPSQQMKLASRIARSGVLAAAIAARPILAQQVEGTPPIPSFDKTEVMVPMRDGVKLHTNVFVPRGFAGNLPIIMIRTPYGIEGGERSFGGAYAELARDGYIFVHQDIRGRFKSEGQFVMLRQMRDKRDPKAIDESTDTYDTIEWLLKNVPRNNGRVGMMGVSYPGWLTVVAMLDPHPALKAVSPQASPADMFIGDDFHHNGAFRLSYGFEYATMMETNKEQTAFAFDDSDTYNWYLKLGSLAHVNEKYLHGTIPSWNDFANHPDYDAFWQRQATAPYIDRVSVPTLSIAGLVGSGRLLWASDYLSAAREVRHEAPQLPRRRAVEPWRVERRERTTTRPDHIRQRHRAGVSPLDSGALVRVLAQGDRHLVASRGNRSRLAEHLAEARLVANEDRGDAEAPLSPGRSRTFFLCADRPDQRLRCVRLRSRQPGAVPRASDPADVWARIDLGALALRRSAFSQGTSGCRELANGAAHR